MTLTNELGKQKTVPGTIFGTLLILLSPFAPHLCEELWEHLHLSCHPEEPFDPAQDRLRDEESHTIVGGSIFVRSWPKYNPSLITEAETDLIIQINGKLRATIRVLADISEEDARTQALAEPNVAKYLVGQEPKKIIFVSGRLINFVVK